MPFELGFFFGAKRFGNKKQRNKNAVVFDSDPFRYQQFISDLNGVDIKAHKNDRGELIRKIRDWLFVSSRRSSVPGHTIVQAQYATFQRDLPGIVAELGLTADGLSFDDFCLLAEEAVRKVLQKG